MHFAVLESINHVDYSTNETSQEHSEEYGETLLQLIQSSGIHRINFSTLVQNLALLVVSWIRLTMIKCTHPFYRNKKGGIPHVDNIP